MERKQESLTGKRWQTGSGKLCLILSAYRTPGPTVTQQGHTHTCEQKYLNLPKMHSSIKITFFCYL